MKKVMFRETSYIMTTRGFIQIKDLSRDDSLVILDKNNKLKVINGFSILTEETRLYHYLIEKSNIYCTSNAEQVMFNRIDSGLFKTNSDFITVSVNDNDYNLRYDVYLAYLITFLSYASFNYDDSRIEFIKDKQPLPQYSRAFYKAIIDLGDFCSTRLSGSDKPYIPSKGGKTNFKSEEFCKTLEEFISMVIEDPSSLKQVFGIFKQCKIAFSYDNNPTFHYITPNFKLAQILVLIFSLANYECFTKFSSRESANVEPYTIVTFTPKDTYSDFSRFKDYRDEKAYGIGTDKTVTLITMTPSSGRYGVMFVPNMTKK